LPPIPNKDEKEDLLMIWKESLGRELASSTPGNVLRYIALLGVEERRGSEEIEKSVFF
jgi:hypothetical protein